MALTNYSKKCTSCGGNKWTYEKDLKLWICQYCGGHVERQEQYDGLYTIKNVVRQVILDCAYRRMEDAGRNLSECQKINARYAGTLVAGICYRLISAVSGHLPAGQDPRSMLSQLRRDYEQLTAEGRQLSDDETALYEFLDSDDAWALLATVFDTLGDQERREYLLTLTTAEKVFSKETNKSLLRFALNNDRETLIDQILAAPENVDAADAFAAVMAAPDSARKGSRLSCLLKEGAVQPGDEAQLEDYLSGEDSMQTKIQLVKAACAGGLTLQVDTLLREILPHADDQTLQELMQTLVQRKLHDREIDLLLEYAAAQSQFGPCRILLETLLASGQFVSINPRQAEQFLCNTDFLPEERVQAMDILCRFSAADRLWEGVAGTYLCRVREAADRRKIVLDALCQHVASVPSREFEQYVLSCTFDEALKPDRIAAILTLPSMNSGFFRELAGKYLQTGKDDPEVRSEVLRQLMQNGIPIDGAALLAYITRPQDDENDAVEFVQMALKNGSVLRSDTLSTYLETCSDRFNPKMFALLTASPFTVSNKALEHYVLRCPDSPAVKAANACALAKQTGFPLGSTACSVTHQGSVVKCSLAQAYILTTRDDPAAAARMVQAMADSGTRLNSEINVSGKVKKFSRYAQEQREALSPTAQALCQEHRLFSRFF